MFLPENSYGKDDGKICCDFNPDFLHEPNYERLILETINAHKLLYMDRQMTNGLKEEETSFVHVDWI